MSKGIHMHELFVTPMWHSSLADYGTHKEGILNYLNEVRKTQPSALRSNMNAYQSHPTLILTEELAPVFKHIMEDMMRVVIQDCELKVTSASLTYAWVNFNDNRSAFNMPHNHAETFSGVFYAQIPENSGVLVINNDASNSLWDGNNFSDMTNKYLRANYPIFPKEGDIYIWPSYLEHFVTPNNHDDCRVSISFNIKCANS
jgi:uncharacterized protein (TIGR02466 family)